MSPGKRAIGGYFELEMAPAGYYFQQNFYAYQSARSALLALLERLQPSRLWLPHYICGSLLKSIHRAGVRMEFYSIGSGFEVLEDVCLGENDFFYYVNYFGLCMGNVRQLLSKISPKHVILDFAQAWFEKPPECQAAIYSPRKFFGVPDGGLLYTQMTMERLSFETGLEMQSMSHLLLRLCAEPEAGYEAYKNSESALSDVGIKSMSKMTHKILASIDHERVCAARSENYLTLHRLLGANNLLDLPVSANGPLCYPFLMEDDRLRQKLMEERVFLPTYWSDVLCRVGQTSVEAGLSKNLLPIPLDQRYTSEDMERIAHVINP